MQPPHEDPAAPPPPERSSAPPPRPPVFGIGKASDLLGAWNLYFIAKLLLFWRGLIGLHAIGNLALLVFLALPLRSPGWRRARHWVALPAAIALLYHESWLPSASRALSQAGLLWHFSAAYLAELAGRFVSWPVVAMLLAAAALYFALARLVRADVFVVAALLAAALLHAPARPTAGMATAAAGTAGRAAADGPDEMLRRFYEAQAQRAVPFPAPPEGSPPFDLIFIHVCSLSWDDLAAAGLEGHPLLKSFDIVLRRFNSVSTYSGPSAIRLLRAPCGQSPHKALYEPARQGCYLMPDLERAGFEGQLVLNHDGHFDDFLGFVKAQGVPGAPMPLDGLAAPQRAFDESRVRDDLAVLSRWIERRRKDPAPRVAAYYNTVSLHDGNRLADDARKGSLETYGARLANLLDELQAFVDSLERSGRRAVVVLIPEHGAALRGDAMQIAGLREIPSPAITLVPVGIRVVGPGARRLGEALHSDAATSYLALAHIVSRMLAKPPYEAGGFRPADYTEGMPLTDFVSENETAVILRRGDGYLLRQDQDAWKAYPAPAAR